jgi:large subunit ribosomal protein L15
MKISDLKPAKGSHTRKRRVGRGPGSGRGKTSGRGHKGQKARSGAKKKLGFEGGQMPLIRRLPKRGFTSRSPEAYQIVNVQQLNKFKKDEVVDPEKLKQAQLINKTKDKVKILGKGELKKALTVKAHMFSKSAKEKIEKAEGKTQIIE